MAQLLHSVLNVGANLEGSVEFKKAHHWLPALPWCPSMGGGGRGLLLFHKPTLKLPNSPLAKGGPMSSFYARQARLGTGGTDSQEDKSCFLETDAELCQPAPFPPTQEIYLPGMLTIARGAATASECCWQDHLRGPPLPQLSCPPSPLHSLL